MILDLVGFICTRFQPKPSHGNPFQAKLSKYLTFKNQGVTLRGLAFGEHLTGNCRLFLPGCDAPGACLWRTPHRKMTFFLICFDDNL